MCMCVTGRTHSVEDVSSQHSRKRALPEPVTSDEQSLDLLPQPNPDWDNLEQKESRGESCNLDALGNLISHNPSRALMEKKWRERGRILTRASFEVGSLRTVYWNMGFGSLCDRVRGNIWEYSPSCGMQRGMPVQIPTLFTAVRPRTTQASHCSSLPCGGPGGEGRCSGRDQVMAGK